MKHVTKHDLNDLNLVKRVIEAAFATYSKKMAEYSPSLKWTGETKATVGFKVLRKEIEVHFVADAKKVVITGKLPFIFRVLEGRITKVIAAEMDEWVMKAKAGEFDEADETAATTEIPAREASDSGTSGEGAE